MGTELEQPPPSPVENAAWHQTVQRGLDRLLRLLVRVHAPHAIRRPISGLYNWLTLFWWRDRERARDAESNALLTLPPDETITFPVFWLVELFTPSYLHGLSRRLQRPRWRTPPWGWRDKRPPLRWLIDARESSRSAGWTGLGTVSRRQQDRWDPNLQSELPPDGFDSVRMQLCNVTPSITALVAAFVLSDDQAKTVHRLFALDTRARIVRGGRFPVESAEQRKEHEVSEFRHQMHMRAGKWLANRYPGVFAGEDKGQLPVIDFLVTTAGDAAGNAGPRDYMRSLGFVGDWGAWRSAEIPGLTLHMTGRHDLWHKRRDAFTLAARVGDARPSLKLDELFGDKTQSDIWHAIYALDTQYVRGLATRLAFEKLLQVKRSEAARTRDLAGRRHGSRARTSNKQLRDSLLRSSLDTTAICHDLIRLIEDRDRYSWDCADFKVYGDPAKRLRAGASRSLVSGLAEAQKEAAEDLREQDRSLRELLAVVASINATLANIWLQRIAIFFAVASVVVAVLALRSASG